MKSETMKRLETLDLERGQTKIIGMNNTTKEDRVQLLYAQFIDRDDTTQEEQDLEDYEVDLTSINMAGDDRFRDKAQLSWVPHTLEAVKMKFSGKVYAKAVELCEDDSEEKLFVSLDILNPTVEHPKFGTVYEKLKLIESHIPQGNDTKYLDKTLKQDGNSNFLYVQETYVDPEGKIREGRKLGIFRHFRVAGVPEDPNTKGQGKDPKHVLISNDLVHRAKLLDDIEWLERGESIDHQAIKAYRSKKDLTSPQGEQEPSKDKEQV